MGARSQWIANRESGRPSLFSYPSRDRFPTESARSPQAYRSEPRSALVPISLASVARVRRSAPLNKSLRRPSLDRSRRFSAFRYSICATASRSGQHPVLATCTIKGIRRFNLAHMLRSGGEFERRRSHQDQSLGGAWRLAYVTIPILRPVRIAQMPLSLSGAFFTDKLSLLPRIAAARFNGWCQNLELLQFERRSKREFHMFDGIPNSRQISMLRFNSACLAGDGERPRGPQRC